MQATAIETTDTPGTTAKTTPLMTAKTTPRTTATAMRERDGAPPRDETAILSWVRLGLLRGLGPRERVFLGERLDDDPDLLELDARTLGARLAAELKEHPQGEQISLPADIVAQLVAPRLAVEAAAELARARKHGVRLVALVDPDYPELLRHADDPPFVVGTLGPLQRVTDRTIAVVGARRAAGAYLDLAREIAYELASEGIVVASGLAKGIDRAAHEGALAAPGGRTIAVLGCGLGRVYPAEHRKLADQILDQGGALLSELPVDSPPRKHHFPQRNRIVSGVASATVVVAAGEKSGALITARHASDQGRTVFAVPGRREDELAVGTNWLIRRELAHLAESAEQVLDKLNWRPVADTGPALFVPRTARRRVAQPPLPGAPGVLERLLADGRPRTFDDLLSKAGLGPSRVVVALGQLQAAGRIRARGSLFELAS